MNLFIGCSSSKIDDKYSILSKELIDDISKIENIDLVFGASNSGLMGDVYNSFLNNNKKITGVIIMIILWRDLIRYMKLVMFYYFYLVLLGLLLSYLILYVRFR